MCVCLKSPPPQNPTQICTLSTTTPPSVSDYSPFFYPRKDFQIRLRIISISLHQHHTHHSDKFLVKIETKVSKNDENKNAVICKYILVNTTITTTVTI